MPDLDLNSVAVTTLITNTLTGLTAYFAATKSAKKEEAKLLNDRYSALFDQMQKQINSLSDENEECRKRDNELRGRLSHLEAKIDLKLKEKENS